MNITEVREFVNAKGNEGHEIKRQRIAEEVNELESGHAMINTIREGLSRFDQLDYFARSKDQVQMHNLMLSCLAKLIYGPEIFDRFRRNIVKANGFKSVEAFFACMLPRREGKSISLAQLICVLLVVCPWIYCVLIVNNTKNAELLTAKIKEFLGVVFNKFDKHELPTDNKRSIHVSHPGGKVSKFMAFSGQGNPNK